jgi:threonylcarbamoyladenosine tRNA methylthiotransferase MtaB
MQVSCIHEESSSPTIVLTGIVPASCFLVTGCAVELNAEKFKADGADYTLTNPDKKLEFSNASGLKSREIPVENFCENSLSDFPFRSRAFIKVQEGCDNFCSYCIVPVVRGASRSRNLAETVADCRKNIEAGFPEIVLTGVNTCNYFDSGYGLAGLIKEISSIPGDFRIRLSSTEPHPGDLSLLELMAENPKICRFLHVSMVSWGLAIPVKVTSIFWGSSSRSTPVRSVRWVLTKDSHLWRTQ